MASMRDIKRRKGSIQSTGQITKAMKLVSTVKLQKAKQRAEQTRPYFRFVYETVQSLLCKSSEEAVGHFCTAGSSPKKAIILITSNRGLAGGYNSNIIKLVTGSGFAREDCKIYAIGRKGRDALARRGYSIQADYSNVINAPLFTDAQDIGREVLEAFQAGEVGEIYLAYTGFKNTVSHIPTLLRLLPVERTEEQEAADLTERLTLMNYEPDPEEVLDAVIPRYLNSLIFGALIEAVASENGARMQAMDSATNNAEDMIADLTLKYNRARQGAITQELTEIIAGANAIG